MRFEVTQMLLSNKQNKLNFFLREDLLKKTNLNNIQLLHIIIKQKTINK